MVTYQFKMFFAKAKSKDPVTGEYLYPDMARAVSDIGGLHPEGGVGSKLGGYVCICDFCGRAFPTYDPTRRFCDGECKNAYYKIHHRKVSFRKNNVPFGVVKKICACCNKEFEVNHAIIDDGKGIFCNIKCYNKFRLLKPLWFTCNSCKTPFKAITSDNALFCCINCEEKFKDKPSGQEVRPIIIEWDDIKQKTLRFNDNVNRAYRKYVTDISIDDPLKYEDYPKLTKDFVDPFRKLNNS